MAAVRVKRVYPVSGTKTTGTLATASIGATVDTSKSFIINPSYRCTGSSNSPTDRSARFWLSSSTEVSFETNASTTDTFTFRCFVIEFESGVSCQHFQPSDIDDGETVTITAVDRTKAWVVPLGVKKGGTGFSNDDMVRYRLTADTTVTMNCGGATPTDLNGSFTVVQADECAVEEETWTLTSHTTTSDAHDFTNTVSDTAKTMLFCSCDTTSSAIGFDDMLFVAELTDSNTITVSRAGTASITITFTVFIVEFTDAVTIQRGSISQGAGTTTTDTDITAVDLDYSHVRTTGCANGWSHPTNTLDASNYGNTFTSVEFLDTDTHRIQRNAGASSTSVSKWEVGEWEPAAVAAATGDFVTVTFW